MVKERSEMKGYWVRWSFVLGGLGALGGFGARRVRFAFSVSGARTKVRRSTLRSCWVQSFGVQQFWMWFLWGEV